LKSEITLNESFGFKQSFLYFLIFDNLTSVEIFEI
jgi:hypothetical protein